MKILCVHAHFDDFEFTAAGTFELWRRRVGNDVRRRVLVCTDGKAGHHFRTRQETGELRIREQQESARVGGYEFELLRLPTGQAPREACLQVTTDLLAALWRAVPPFEPVSVFCSPPAPDPLAGGPYSHPPVDPARRPAGYPNIEAPCATPQH